MSFFQTAFWLTASLVVAAPSAAPSAAQLPQRFTPSGALKYMPLLDGWVSVRESPFGEVFQRDPKSAPSFAVAYVNEFDPTVDKNSDDLAADVRANFTKFVQIPNAIVLSSVVSRKGDRPYPCVEGNALIAASSVATLSHAERKDVQVRFLVCRDMRKQPRGFVVGVSHTSETLPESFERQVRDFLRSVSFRRE